MPSDAATPVSNTSTPSALDDLFALDRWHAQINDALSWVQTHLLVPEVGLQAALIIAAFVPGALFGPRLRTLIQSLGDAHAKSPFLKRAARAFAVLATPIALYLSLNIFKIILASAGNPTSWIDGAISLLSAWIVIRMVTLIIRSPFWSRVAFYVIWPIAVLDAFNLLNNVVVELQSLAIPLGKDDSGKQVAITLFDVLRTLVYFTVLFWGANTIGRFLETRIEKIDELTPSLRALLVKVMRVVLPITALLVALQIVGFNLATLAIFSGAVGLGIGLGLQGVVANFVAGFTLIADRSIKPFDVIQIKDTFGWVTEMQARYVALRTRDGTEHLIPNNTFMSEGVINWSRSDRLIRLHAPFSVSYSTKDLRAVQALAVEAAKAAPRVASTPSPVCNVTAFGDSAVEFDLRFWIQDPVNGMANVRSDVFLNVWDALKANGIEIPFPQRDLHIRSWAQDAAPPRGDTSAQGAS